MVSVANATAIDGDPQCKMENASDRDGIGDDPIWRVTKPKPVPLPLRNPRVFHNMARDCPSDSRPRLLSPMLTAALIICPTVFFSLFYARLCQKNLKPPSKFHLHSRWAWSPCHRPTQKRGKRCETCERAIFTGAPVIH